MEKIVTLVWKPKAVSSAGFKAALLGRAAKALLAAGVGDLRICIADDDVLPAAPYRIESSDPPYDGLVSFWLNSARDYPACREALAPHVASRAAYLVTESEPIRNRDRQPGEGERTPGMNQVVALQKPDHLDHTDWLGRWLDDHTQLAIDIQSTFGYRQNLVARSLEAGQVPLAAVVEENFPTAAMSSRLAFYDAGDDEALCQAREKQMIESAMRFIDFERIDCIPMSEYNLGGSLPPGV